MARGIRVLYTGDYSREEDRHLPQAQLLILVKTSLKKILLASWQAEIPNVRIHVLIVECGCSLMLEVEAVAVKISSHV